MVAHGEKGIAGDMEDFSIENGGWRVLEGAQNKHKV